MQVQVKLIYALETGARAYQPDRNDLKGPFELTLQNLDMPIRCLAAMRSADKKVKRLDGCIIG